MRIRGPRGLEADQGVEEEGLEADQGVEEEGLDADQDAEEELDSGLKHVYKCAPWHTLD